VRGRVHIYLTGRNPPWGAAHQSAVIHSQDTEGLR